MCTDINKFFSTGTTQQITQRLLGCELINHTPDGIVSGLIVEAEAYLGKQDSAAHSYRGHRTPANEALYAAPGTIYIYSLHGHFMLDVATQEQDEPQGILIRAIEPVQGLQIMPKWRTKQTGFNLTNGPGKLAQALGINSLALNMTLLNPTTLDIDLQPRKTPQVIQSSPRINVSKRGEWTDRKLRFFVAGNPYVSKIAKREINYKTYGWK